MNKKNRNKVSIFPGRLAERFSVGLTTVGMFAFLTWAIVGISTIIPNSPSTQYHRELVHLFSRWSVCCLLLWSIYTSFAIWYWRKDYLSLSLKVLLSTGVLFYIGLAYSSGTVLDFQWRFFITWIIGALATLLTLRARDRVLGCIHYNAFATVLMLLAFSGGSR